MDFDAWKPEDTARRYAIYLGSCLGVFSFIALWMGLQLNMILALLGGAGIGYLIYLVVYPLVLAYYRR